MLNDVVGWFVGHDIEVSLELSLLDSYAGLILPLTASATCTFLFRQFFLTVPEELCEAAKMDGASPMTFFWKIFLPLSKTNIAALVVIEFVYGWNQYLWPLLNTTNPKMTTAVIGLHHLLPSPRKTPPDWHIASDPDTNRVAGKKLREQLQLCQVSQEHYLLERNPVATDYLVEKIETACHDKELIISVGSGTIDDLGK